jgi:hypothetical protein
MNFVKIYSVRPYVQIWTWSFRPSKIFFIAFFSVTVDGRNLIFGYKRFYTHWTYIHIFLSNYWWQKSDIWSQASYRYPISWEAFLDPSDSYFLFADFVDFYTHLTYICICTFFVAFSKQLLMTGIWYLVTSFI